MPPDSPPVAVAYYLMAEMGQGCRDIFGIPFFDLPPDVGSDLLALIQALTPMRERLLAEIRDELRQKRGGSAF